MSLFDAAIKPLLLVKSKKINACCREFLKGNVLDIGAGRCYIAKELESRNKLKVKCLDVKDLSRTGMKVIVYGGKKMPFKENEFDSAIVSYVLHHCDEPIAVLREAKRVCRGNIVIFEDTKPSFITNFMDFMSNKLRGVKTPFKFRPENEWKTIFKKLNLRIVAVKHGVEKEWFYPLVEHTMFVVKK